MSRLGLWTEDFPYPLPRKRAGPEPPIGPFGGAEASPVTTRLWPFYLEEAGSHRGQLTSPPFSGPALVKELRGSMSTHTGTPVDKFDVRWSTVPIESGGDLPIGTRLGGTSLFEEASFISDQGTTGQAGSGAFARGSLAQPYTIELPLNYVITEPQFYLTVLVRSAGGPTSFVFIGYLTILFAASVNDLALLIG
mgnify:FL=1